MSQLSVARRGGRTNRKFGRMLRKPSHKRYNIGKRWEVNKKKRIAKEAKRQERLRGRHCNECSLPEQAKI